MKLSHFVLLGEPKTCYPRGPYWIVMSTQDTYPIDVEAIRADFPVLDRNVGGDVSTPW